MIFLVVDWRGCRWWRDVSTVMKLRVLNPWATALITTPILTWWLHFPLNAVLVQSGLISNRIDRLHGFYSFISLLHMTKRRNLKWWVPEFFFSPAGRFGTRGWVFPHDAGMQREPGRLGEEKAVWDGRSLLPSPPFSEFANNWALFS